MSDIMSNRQILLIAIALGFIGGFSAVSLANSVSAAEASAAYTTAG
ncbi:hypothetical protein [Sandaracinobacter sp.]